jgi:hypothetical protein
MKIQKTFVIATALVTCAIAIPFAFPLQNGLYKFNSNSAISSIVVFVSGFVFMVLMGWVKRVHK